MNNVLLERPAWEADYELRFADVSDYKDLSGHATYSKNFSDFGLTSYLMTEWNDFSLSFEQTCED